MKAFPSGEGGSRRLTDEVRLCGMYSGFSAQLNVKRRGRGSNTARSRLAEGIFSFLMQPDECTKRALLERRTFVGKLERKKSLLNARRQRSAYAPSSPSCDYRQPPRASRRNTSLRSGSSCPLVEQERGKSRSLPRARGRCPEGAEEVRGRTGKNNLLDSKFSQAS